MLIQIDLLHFCAVQGRLKVFDLASELVCLLSAVRITNLVLHVRVVLANHFHLNLLLVDHAAQCVDHSLKLLHRLDLSVTQLYRLTLLRELLSSNLCSLLLDDGKLFFALILDVRRNRSRLQLVLLQISDSFLEAGILQIEGLFLKFKVK